MRIRNLKTESLLMISKIWKQDWNKTRHMGKHWKFFRSNFLNKQQLVISYKVCLLQWKKKTLKSCLDLHFHTLTIRFFFNPGWEIRKRNTLRLLLVHLGERVLAVVLDMPPLHLFYYGKRKIEFTFLYSKKLKNIQYCGFAILEIRNILEKWRVCMFCLIGKMKSWEEFCLGAYKGSKKLLNHLFLLSSFFYGRTAKLS